MSFPVLNFNIATSTGEPAQLKWFPSEYMCRHKEDQYCLALEKFSRPNEILMGGTFMRQNNFIFDVEANKLGIVRAACNKDLNMIDNEGEMIASGQRWGLDPNHTQSWRQVQCQHGRTINGQSNSDNVDGSGDFKKDLSRTDLVILILLIFLAIFVVVFCLWKRCKKNRDQLSGMKQMSEEVPQQETSAKGGSPNVHDNTNIVVFQSDGNGKPSLQGQVVVTEHEQIHHPEAIELEIESQYSSRNSQIAPATDTDRNGNGHHPANITEKAIQSMHDNFNHDDVEHGIDLGQ